MSQKDYTTRTVKSKHLNITEREIIERKVREKSTVREIAELLGRSESTIRREIKRGSVEQRRRNKYVSRNPKVPEYITYTEYFAEAGQREYEKNRERSGAKRKILKCKEFVEYAEGEMKEKKYSPDAIVGYARENKLFEDIVCTQTLYNWIDEGLLKIKNIDLLQKVRRKPRTNRCTERKKKLGRSIDERPEIIESKKRIGDLEGDSIVGKDGKSSALSFVDRATNEAIVLKAESKTASETVRAIKEFRDKYPERFRIMFKSITFDNGSEFACSEELEALGIEVYYAHPYSAWERGKNEHFNGMLRRFIPKGKDISSLTQDDLDRFANYLNLMPRKKFNYRSPHSLFCEYLSRSSSL